MVQTMKICILLLHFFCCSACRHHTNLGPYCADNVQTHDDSYFPQMQKRVRRSYYSSNLLVSRSTGDKSDLLKPYTVFGRDRSQAPLSLEPTLVPGLEKAPFPSKGLITPCLWEEANTSDSLPNWSLMACHCGQEIQCQMPVSF